ncbi:MAG: hypothetical protein AB7G12_12630 [Thermoanaerobaculia bacterium]
MIEVPGWVWNFAAVVTGWYSYVLLKWVIGWPARRRQAKAARFFSACMLLVWFEEHRQLTPLDEVLAFCERCKFPIDDRGVRWLLKHLTYLGYVTETTRPVDVDGRAVAKLHYWRTPVAVNYDKLK